MMHIIIKILHFFFSNCEGIKMTYIMLRGEKWHIYHVWAGA